MVLRRVKYHIDCDLQYIFKRCCYPKLHNHVSEGPDSHCRQLSSRPFQRYCTITTQANYRIPCVVARCIPLNTAHFPLAYLHYHYSIRSNSPFYRPLMTYEFLLFNSWLQCRQASKWIGLNQGYPPSYDVSSSRHVAYFTAVGRTFCQCAS